MTETGAGPTSAEPLRRAQRRRALASRSVLAGALIAGGLGLAAVQPDAVIYDDGNPVAASVEPELWLYHAPPQLALPGERTNLVFHGTCVDAPVDSPERLKGCRDADFTLTYRDGATSGRLTAAMNPQDGTYTVELPPVSGAAVEYTASLAWHGRTTESSWDIAVMNPIQVVELTDADLARPSSRGRDRVRRAWGRGSVQQDSGRGAPLGPPTFVSVPDGSVVVPDPATDEFVIFRRDGSERRVPSPRPFISTTDVADFGSGRVAIVDQTRATVTLSVVDLTSGKLIDDIELPDDITGRLVRTARGVEVVTYPGPVSRPVVMSGSQVVLGAPRQNIPVEQSVERVRVRVGLDAAHYCLMEPTVRCVTVRAPWNFAEFAFAGELADGSVVIGQRVFREVDTVTQARYLLLTFDPTAIDRHPGVSLLNVDDRIELSLGGRFRLDSDRSEVLASLPTLEEFHIAEVPANRPGGTR